MTAATHRLIRVIFLLLAGLLGWDLVCYAPRLILEPLHEGDVYTRWRSILCATSVAAGIFVFLLAAGRCFPLASRNVKLAFEIAPWVGLGGLVIGGLV